MICQEILDEISDYAKSKPDVETCGIISKNKFLPCENLSPVPSNHFIIDPFIIIEKNPEYIYHSHVAISAKPSKLDRLYQQETDIPFVIYSLKDNDFYILKK
jgi:proteasome lid subunit RPN8/RPN11